MEAVIKKSVRTAAATGSEINCCALEQCCKDQIRVLHLQQERFQVALWQPRGLELLRLHLGAGRSNYGAGEAR